MKSTSADGGGGGEGDEQVHQPRPYGMSLINNEINMTNCSEHCKHFFEFLESIHFKVLISYWIMAGYLGDRFRSVEEAYEKGLVRLIDLIYKEKMLKFSDDDREMIEFAGSSRTANCRHPGFCLGNDRSYWEIIGFVDMIDLELGQVRKVVLSKDEMLSMNRNSVPEGFRHAPDQVPKKYSAAFNPTPNSLKQLLENVKNPSVLLLRGFNELSLPSDSFPLDKLKTLTTLEISGSTHLTTIPENTISQMIHLQYLNLSDLPIEAFPSSFFTSLAKLSWLILRGCRKLLALDFGTKGCLGLDLSHCTSLQRCDVRCPRLEVLDLSYTPLDPLQPISTSRYLSHLYLRGSKLEYLSFLTISGRIKVLDLSLTKVKHLPPLANLTNLCALSLRGLELDSLETMASLSNRLIELDLMGLKIICSSQLELKLDFLQSLENLQFLNLSQTSISKLPDISKLVRLKELLLAGCQHLKVVPDLQALTNLETLDLSLPNDSSSYYSCQLEIETKGQRGLFPFPKSLRKLVLTNRLGIQKLFSMTEPGDLTLEFLDLRGTDVLGWDSKLEAQKPQEITPKAVEIHVISIEDEPNRQQQSNNKPTWLDQVEKVFTKWEALPSDIFERNLDSTISQEQVVRLSHELSYIRENIERLESSSNWKRSKELLQELMDAATILSAADFVADSANFKQVLRVVVKLKLLVPRKQIDDSHASEGTKQKKKPFFRRSMSKDNDDFTDIIKGMHEMEPDLLNSYESLTTTQKNCLLCFSIFPYEDDRDKITSVLKSIMIKKKILIYWWIGEGFITPYHEENVDYEPTLEQNPNVDPIAMTTEIGGGRKEANKRVSATKEVKQKTVDDIGKEILKILAEKGFINPVIKKGRESGSCCIHPFVHSFVIKRAKEEGFFDFDQETSKLVPNFTRSQRACFLKPHVNVPSSCELWTSYINSPKKLKSFENVKTLFNVNEYMIDIKREWFSKMKNLHVLHLGNWDSEHTDLIEVNDQKFMEDLKKMSQLRVLSLQGLPTIMKLPDSICFLKNLIILDLRECSYLQELPVDIGSLKNLTHLDISNCPLLNELPKGISLLLKLEVLKGFLITGQEVAHDQEQTQRCGLLCRKNNKGCTSKDLLNLKRLRELSIIVNISKFPEDKDLKVFKEMKELCKLKIFWQRSICSDDIMSATGQESSVRPLRWQNKLACWKRQECENREEEDDREESKHLDSIEKLELWCFPYENAPDWINPRELKSLRKLYIMGGNLKKLHGSATDESRWNVETLRLMYLHNLDIQWPELKSMFPKLTYLEKVQCDQHALFPCNEEGVWRFGS